jgi:hypothetical protein
MAEDKPSRRASPAVLLAILAAIAFFSILILVVLQGGQNGDDGADDPPPELGPDTAQSAPDAEPTQLADRQVSPASAGSGDIAFADDSLTFEADLPDGPNAVLSILRRDTEDYLAKMKADAREDFNAAKRAGEPPRPWDIEIDWTYSARAGDLVSLWGVSSEYTGGVHPNRRFDTLIARADTGQKVDFSDMLLLERSPSPALTIAICEGLKVAKLKRINSATIMDEPIVCAGANANANTQAARIALAPSNVSGKFGGVYAYYEPYAVGPYVEGAYRLTIQQEVFVQDLRPEYRSLFGGEAPTISEDAL